MQSLFLQPEGLGFCQNLGDLPSCTGHAFGFNHENIGRSQRAGDVGCGEDVGIDGRQSGVSGEITDGEEGAGRTMSCSEESHCQVPVSLNVQTCIFFAKRLLVESHRL